MSGYEYYTKDHLGCEESDPSVERLREILQAIRIDEDDYYPIEVADLIHEETQWILSAYSNGSLVWCKSGEEEEENSKHMKGVSREEILALWLKLAEGDIGAVEAQPWLPGGLSLSEAERAEHIKRIDEEQRARFKAFYDSLGPEREGIPCRHPGCSRNAIHYSVLCRPHHFENLYKGRPCPFTD